MDGARKISELTWSQMARIKGIVTLENGETKNDDARSVCLDDELKEIFNRLRENRKRNGKAKCRLDQWGMILGALH
jgi:uncharacterized protein YicC (UPF0701 family)